MVRGQSVNLDLKVVLNEETAQVLDADGKEILDGDEVDDSVLVRSLQEWSRPGLSDVPLPPQVGSICDATGVGELEQAMKRVDVCAGMLGTPWNKACPGRLGAHGFLPGWLFNV